MSDYKVRDESLPLIVLDDAFDGSIFNPVSILVSYVNRLYDAGFGSDTIRADYADIYLLDYYVSQVRNGGHSQFIGNSRKHLFDNIAGATRGAKHIGLPELVSILERLEAWCRDNPEVASRQTGSGDPAELLKHLDKELFSLEFADADLSKYLETLPNHLSKDLRTKLFVPENTEAMIDKFISETLRQAKDTSPEEATKATLELLTPLYDWKALNSYRSLAKSQLESVPRSLNRFGAQEEAALAAELRSRVSSRLAKPDGRSKYELLTWVWMVQHANLVRVPRDEWESAVTAVVARSPFAAKERAVRDWEALHQLIPNEDILSLAFLLGQVLTDRAAVGSPAITYSDPSNNSARELHMLSVGDEKYFLEKSKGRTRLREVRTRRLKALFVNLLLFANNHGVVAVKPVLSKLFFSPNWHPGRVVAETDSNMNLQDLIKDLFLPEAIGLIWPAEDGQARQMRAASVERGLILEADKINKKIVWHIATPDGPVLFEADSEGVVVEKPKVTLNRAELRDVRPATTRQ